ncbi:hypothetical protein [Ottowia thiooxydans]|uniref:Translation initiation factor IF-2 n=1 Tax=Ottowia thiooxydans TaxID=219182 RepID=A0ABV2QGX6_9BURK
MTASNQLKTLLAGLATVAMVGSAMAQSTPSTTPPPGGVPASGEQTSRGATPPFEAPRDSTGKARTETKANVPASGERNARGASGMSGGKSTSMDKPRTPTDGKTPAAGESPQWSKDGKK